MDIDYRVIYSGRKTIGLTVERDRSIVVRAPIGASDEAIRQAVEAKKLWLYEKVNHSQKYPPQPVRKEFVTGETLMYLGRYYRLEVTDDDAPGVRFHNRFYISRQLFVIDYLIVHELAHLLEPNHTAQFWNIIAVQVPRYALAREWLREHGASLEEDLK